MHLLDPKDMPTLEAVFGDNSRVFRPLQRANIETVTPVMLLPREQLITGIHGIGKNSATYITGALAQKDLPHRRLNDRLADFLDQTFGSVDAAPIGALHMASVFSEVCTRTYYARLSLIRFLESRHPHMTIDELTAHSGEHLAEIVREEQPSTNLLTILSREIKEINHRLANLEYTDQIKSSSILSYAGNLSLVG